MPTRKDITAKNITVKDITVHSWAELQDAIFVDSWDNGIQRFRSPYAFRGLSDKDFELKTTLCRLGGDFRQMEKHLLRNFRKYSPKGTLQRDSVWDWLSIAQHHGLPTRLLDWTYSPYVAMHFATSNRLKYNLDGVIWCVNFVRSTELLPPALKNALMDEGSNVFTAEMLESVCPAISDFDRLGQPDIKNSSKGSRTNKPNEAGDEIVVFLEPPSFDDRIVNQFALFSLMSDPNSLLSAWFEKHTDLFFRIIIPAGLKHEVRDKLDQVNITERVLFPGLDGLSAWLSRHYRAAEQ